MDKIGQVGWIGLGKMGIPMSKNLIKAGYPLMVYDLYKDKTRDLGDLVFKTGESPMDMASETDVIISMISDDPALETVALGPEGVFKTAASGSVFVDMSTVSPVVSGRVGEAALKKGISYLRAPVSGSTLFADAGTLTILVSGPKDAYERCRELFDVMGGKIFYVGAGEEARYLKLLLNMMVAITSAMVAEALTFGELGGMDWTQMIDVINNSAVAAPQIGFKAQMLKDRDFDPAFTTSQMAKDMDIALSTGREVNAPMPLTTLVRQFLSTMIAQGKGDIDFFGLVTLLEKMAGIEDRS